MDEPSATGRGWFISFEGVDGVGKSTQVALLVERLAARGHAVLAVREPGGTAVGEAVRELVLHRPLEPPPVAWAEALVLVAARAQLVHEVILPALARGTVVVSDRFVDSTLAYQGGGRGLGTSALRALHAAACADLWPDRTLLLELDVTEAARRRDRSGGPPDRIERETAERAALVAAAFARIAEEEPDRVVRIAASAPAEAVAERVLAVADALITAVGV